MMLSISRPRCSRFSGRSEANAASLTKREQERREEQPVCCEERRCGAKRRHVRCEEKQERREGKGGVGLNVAPCSAH